ncbi:hypothetical protein B0J17DRAFT_771468 [Rhizoctonia solani]|nr:hypothetical protein B0J17DRAFT_771468 [Rhizoctonia solani]
MRPQQFAEASCDSDGRSQLHITKENTDASNLASCLHLEIKSLNIESTQKPAQSHSDLAGVQNKLAVHRVLHDLPVEILCKIFDTAIHDTDPGTSRDLAVVEAILALYRRLCSLTSVCSHWRRICLSTGSFWSLIPILRRKGDGPPMDMCLERAGDSKLHLVGEVGVLDPQVVEVITQYGPRIQTLDISGVRHNARKIVASVLKHSNSGGIANLSVRDYQACYRRDRFEQSRNLFSPDSSEYTLFSRFADSLNVLRLCGFNLNWTQVHFSRLVELRLEEVALEDKAMATNMLLAVASAPELRRLQLSRMEVRQDITRENQSDQPISLPVSLRELQSLCLRDIHRDLLPFLLQSINPGSYQTLVGFTQPSSFYSQSSNFGNAWEDILQIQALELKGFNIDTLMISGNWLSGSKFYDMLWAVPTITSLCIRGHSFNKRALRALIRLPESGKGGGNEHFPTIRRLHILDADFDLTALDELKEVVKSHGVQELRLGRLLVPLPSSREDNMVRFEHPEDGLYTKPIEDWLRATVPNFTVARRMKDIPDSEFWMDIW